MLCLLRRGKQMVTKSHLKPHVRVLACARHTCGARGRRRSSPLPLCGFSRQLPDVRLIHTHQNVLRFDVGVDDVTLGVQIVQTLKYLQCKRHGDNRLRTCKKLFFFFSSIALMSIHIESKHTEGIIDMEPKSRQ